MGVARQLAAPLARATILELRGSFDVFRRDELNAAFSAVASEHYVVVDLTAVTYADSTILSELVRLHRFLTARAGSLVFVGASSTIHRLLSITGLDRLFDVRGSLADVEGEYRLHDAKRIIIEYDQSDPPPGVH
jgi:anti-sigma B factor antagonist